MRLASRFARRVRAWAKDAGLPVIFSPAGERKDEIADANLPRDPKVRGVFLVVVARAPASVWHVQRTAEGRIGSIERKRPWVNHYAFPIWDGEWGHGIIRFCPHLPFKAMIILHGHEAVAAEAARRGLGFRNEDNCFTAWSHAAGLGQIAETLSSQSSEGRLGQSLRALAALLILREQVLPPLLAGALPRKIRHRPRHLVLRDPQHRNLRNGMNDLFREVGIAA